MADVMSGPYLAGLQLRYQREAKEEERAKRKRLNDALMSAFKPGRDEALPFETDEEQEFGLPPLQGNVAGFERRPAEFDDDQMLQSMVAGGFAPEAYAIVSGRADEERKGAAAIRQKILEKQIEMQGIQDFMDRNPRSAPSKYGYSTRQGFSAEFDPNAAIQRETAAEDYRAKYGRYPPGYASNEPQSAPEGSAPPSVRPSAPAPIGATPSRTTAAQTGPPPGLPYGERQKWFAEDAKGEREAERQRSLKDYEAGTRERESGLKRLEEIDAEAITKAPIEQAAMRIEQLLPQTYTGPVGQFFGAFDPNSREMDKLSSVIMRASIKPGQAGTANSGYEQELLLKTVPQRSDPKRVTRNFTRALMATAKNDRDRQEFMHSYMDKFGDLRHATVEWSRYISDNPTLARESKDTNVLFNKNKKSWQEYFPWASQQEPTNSMPTVTRDANGNLRRVQ